MTRLSLVLLIIAAATFLAGLVREGVALLWVSIGSSLLAGVLLAVSIFRRPAREGGPEPGWGLGAEEASPLEGPTREEVRVVAPPASVETTAEGEGLEELAERREGAAAPRASARRRRTGERASEGEGREEPSRAGRRAAPARPRRAARAEGARPEGAAEGTRRRGEPRPTAAKKGARQKEAKERPSQVVAFPDRGTYHRPECRVVRDRPGLPQFSLGRARRLGYRPCGLCRPE